MSYAVQNKPIDEAFEFLKYDRDVKTQRAIAEIDRLLNHDTKALELACQHKHCGKKGVYKVDLEVSTLLPFRVNEGFDDLGIVFGDE